MSIQINTSGRRVNRYSDFKLVMSVTKNGDPYKPVSFVMVFYVDSWEDCENRYVASRIDGVSTNCEIDNYIITVYFDSPGFNLGQLKLRMLDSVEDAGYSDGTLDTCTPISLPVEIVAGAGDTDSIVLGYSSVYFGENHDLVFEGAGPSIGEENNLII